jgi:2-keto-4-pentenoate hydratase/2-oxohepta-3-ene-1,7-dioic acid hydratase in catechol pathway
MKVAAFRHPDDPASTRRLALVVGHGRDVFLHPFADGVEVIAILAAEPNDREAAADKAAESYGLRLDEVIVLAPVEPVALRSFAAFEGQGEGEPAFRFVDPRTVVGPFDDIPYNQGTGQLDFGLGLAAVVCRDVRDAARGQAKRAIGGYVVVNEWSGPDVQRDLATTLGPWVVTADELDGHRDADGLLDLSMSVSVNGERVGADVSGHMRWTFEQLLVHASRGSGVRAGEVLTSGTCGSGSLAQIWDRSGRPETAPLGPGDVVELTVEGIGTLRSSISGPADPQRLVTTKKEHTP